MGTALCTSSLVAAGGVQATVGRPTRASLQAVLLPKWPRTRDVAQATALQSTWEPSQRLRKPIRSQRL